MRMEIIFSTLQLINVVMNTTALQCLLTGNNGRQLEEYEEHSLFFGKYGKITSLPSWGCYPLSTIQFKICRLSVIEQNKWRYILQMTNYITYNSELKVYILSDFLRYASLHVLVRQRFPLCLIFLQPANKELFQIIKQIIGK